MSTQILLKPLQERKKINTMDVVTIATEMTVLSERFVPANMIPASTYPSSS